MKRKIYYKNNLSVMDNGYYVFEVVPKNGNYTMRLFLDKNKKPLEYYLDITYSDGEVNILDEDELIEAYHTGDIMKDDYELVGRMKQKLLSEIENKTNQLMNLDYRKFLVEDMSILFNYYFMIQ